MPLAATSRAHPSEARPALSSERGPEPMAVEEDETTANSPHSPEQEPFVLSPIPPLASLPLSKNPHRQVFRPLTAEESDVEDLKSMRTNPYLLRSIEPISFKPPVHRMNSSSSLLSRRDSDPTSPRSIPRSSLDVHMSSCSSSPSTTQFVGRERDDPMNASEVSRPRKLSGDRNKVSSQPADAESQHDRWRAQLHHILETPQMANIDSAMLRSPESRPMNRYTSPESSIPVTRTTSPTSSASSSASSQPIQNSGLLRPPLSRASTSAMQAERERARTTSLKESSTPTTSSSTKESLRDVPSYTLAAPAPPQPSMPNHYYSRRPSVSSTRGKPAAPPQPSTLSRNQWTMLDPQRTF